MLSAQDCSCAEALIERLIPRIKMRITLMGAKMSPEIDNRNDFSQVIK